MVPTLGRLGYTACSSLQALNGLHHQVTHALSCLPHGVQHASVCRSWIDCALYTK